MIYLLQFDSYNPLLSDCVEKLGDYCIYKNNYILNTSLVKLKVINKLKKILSRDELFFVNEIHENELNMYPFIVKEWFYKNSNKQSNYKEDEVNRIENNYDSIKQNALLKLDLLLDNVNNELKKQMKLKKEV
jgi:hypothetical protein